MKEERFSSSDNTKVLAFGSKGSGECAPLVVNESGNLVVEASIPSNVTVGNFPTTQQVSGSVSVGNFPSNQKVNIDPMVDYDTTLSYTDAKLTGIVVTGNGQTKTMVLGYTGDNLTSIQTTIT